MEKRQKALEVLARTCDRPTSELGPDMELISDLGIDSPKALELLIDLEEALEIDISDEDAAEMVTVGDVLQWVEQHA